MADTIIATPAELNTLRNIHDYLSGSGNLTISDALTELANTKLSKVGDTVYGSLIFSDGATATGVPTPLGPTDASNKEYVDSLIESRKWVNAVKVSTDSQITLYGPQLIKDVSLSLKDRVLVNHQDLPSENGIYDVNATEWTRSVDFDEPHKVNQTAVYDIQDDKSYKQINEVFNIGSDSLVFSPFLTPQIKNVGPGLSLSNSGGVSLLLDAGLKTVNSKLALDLGTDSGLEVNTFLKIKNVVQAGTYTKVQVNSKGQVISGINASTLADYGITNAVSKSGDTITGVLNIGDNKISSSVTENTAFISTNPYGINQGDNKSHLGYLENGLYVNYLRGNRTRIDSELDVRGISKFYNTVRIGGTGYLLARPGDANKPGQLEFASVDGEQRGYIGGGVPGRLLLSTAPNWKYSFSETPLVLNAPILHSQNFQDFAPSLTGQGATGTWNISISGNASTASAVPWSGITGKPASSSGLTWGSNVVKIQTGTASVNPWAAGDPVLVGINGSNTIGVKVDRSRISDSTDQKTIGNIKTDGITQGTAGSISILGQNGGYSGICFDSALRTLAVDANKSGIVKDSAWDWSFTNGTLTDGIVPGDKVLGDVSSSTVATSAKGLKLGNTVLPFTGNGTEATLFLGLFNGEIKQVPTTSLRAGRALVADVAENTGSISGAVDKSYSWTGKNQFKSNVPGYTGVSKFNLESRNVGVGAAGISLVRSDEYGINIGLDPDNVLRIGGYSASPSLFQLNSQGDLTIPGNLHQSSDIRLKKNITVIENALAKVDKLTGVTFTRKDTGDRNTGLIAQDVKSVLPEAVQEDAEGMLSVSYGNVVGLLVQAIKELRSEVESLRSSLVTRK